MVNSAGCDLEDQRIVEISGTIDECSDVVAENSLKISTPDRATIDRVRLDLIGDGTCRSAGMNSI